MPLKSRSFVCAQCLLNVQPTRRLPSLVIRNFSSSTKQRQAEPSRPSVAPKVAVDLKHIRQNAELHERNCISRNYKALASYPARINELFEQWHEHQREARGLRERNNAVKSTLATRSTPGSQKENDHTIDGQRSREQLLVEAKRLKESIGQIEAKEQDLMKEIESMAVALPNLTSEATPVGDEARLVGYINQHPDPDGTSSSQICSHVEIGRRVNLLDFSGAAATSGWGWYFLLNEAALLEQALVQYALSVARKREWGMVAPPSMVYSHIAAACGFQPRDQNGEHQIYAIQQSAGDVGRKPELSMAGTAEIPLAGMKANTTIDGKEFPLKRVGVSRCYRAEAGARGADTKGLYRVHEFTKVEMFAWTLPSTEASTEIFNEMLDIQTEILTSLGLHCRILEMPTADLGASATRKRDIEAFFPSRREIDNGWGELTSVSTCTDYQSRRLGTKVDLRGKAGGGGKIEFPFTVNGTALAVPRVLAAILENGWDEENNLVKVPECLWPWMDGIKIIQSNV